MFAHMIFHEFRRLDVMKLIRIDAHEPIAVEYVLSRDMKHVTTKTCLRKINRLLANRHNPFVA